MRKLLTISCAGVLLCVGTSVFSADWLKGWDAYRSEDYATALREWEPLAKQGDAFAQFNLGVMYRLGQGVPQNDSTAVKWYTPAAKQGNVHAQYNLGVMYEKGQGVIQDNTYAHIWWNFAASKGDKEARNKRDIIERKMTPSKIEKAQYLARECVENNYKGC